MDKNKCEVWVTDDWELWPVSVVYPYRNEATYRCPVCHGPVILMKESQDGRNRAHFEHRPAHVGCSLVYKQRRGVGATPPAPVEPPTGSAATVVPLDYISDTDAEDIIGKVEETTKERLILARVGQGAFRNALISKWKTCSVLDCGPTPILVASHIVPWRLCESNEERLDPNNGLLLTPNLDKLFDRRLISFADTGEILVRRTLREQDRDRLGLSPDMRLRRVPQKVKMYLARHRGTDEWVSREQWDKPLAR